MKPPRLFINLLSAAFALAVFSACARAEENASAVKFSDPAKPGKVKIMIGRGDVRIRAEDTAEVTVVSDSESVEQAPRKDGLRVISAASSFSLTEKDNVVTLDALSDAWAGAGADFRLTVPRNTSIVVQNRWGGDVTCAGVAGDVEINSLSGSVRLEDVAGGLVVSTMNGEIHASIRELRDNKPLSFTSMNGEVVLRVPSDAKASVRLRTQNGSVLTDFDERALVTKTESTSHAGRRTRTIAYAGALPTEAREAIHEATRIGVQVGREVAQAVRDGFEAAQDAERAERDLARAERDRERAERERERATRDATTIDGAPPMPPMPPMPAMPAISGGKLITGTLNGGGPEISVATMNGDVIFRQLKK